MKKQVRREREVGVYVSYALILYGSAGALLLIGFAFGFLTGYLYGVG